MGDKSEKAKQIIDTLRKSAGGSSIPPRAESNSFELGLTAEEVLQRIDRRQVQVVDAIGGVLSTVADTVDELQTSVTEDEKVRRAVRKLTIEVKATRTTVRVLNYTTTGVTLCTCIVVIVLVAWMAQIVQGLNIQVSDARDKLNTVDANTARTQEVILKQAEAHAKRIEAESAMTPQAEEEALEAAIDVQAEAAQAQIETAASRKQPAPPAATKALKEAKAKKAQLRAPARIESLAY